VAVETDGSPSPHVVVKQNCDLARYFDPDRCKPPQAARSYFGHCLTLFRVRKDGSVVGGMDDGWLGEWMMDSRDGDQDGWMRFHRRTYGRIQIWSAWVGLEFGVACGIVNGAVSGF
jgi:hypothetical protein